MRKNILYSVAIVIMVLLGACSNDEILPEAKPEPKPEAPRTISLTASVAEENQNTTTAVHNGDPTTRVTLKQNSERTVEVRWEENDIIKLAFVQGTTTTLVEAIVTSTSIDRKTAHFNIDIPTTITIGDFQLFGVYGGGGIEIVNNKPVVKLPTGAGSATSLNGATESVQSRKDVVIYFEHTMSTSDQAANVIFQHIGSFFCITVKNTSTTSFDNLQEARLVGLNNLNNRDWAFNSIAGGQQYDLVEGVFKNTETDNNHISFSLASSNLSSGQSVSFWGWYPPLQTINWPALKLELRDANNTLATSFDFKDARDAPTAAGKSYYFYAIWDGEKLGFTDAAFANLSATIKEVAVTGTNRLSALLSDYDKSNVTALKVTGPIKSSDFTVMRSEMRALTYLDLSGITRESNDIPDGAFSSWDIQNTTISTIILPPNIETIGKLAFYKCSGLTGSLNLPTALKSIGESAFHDCSGLTGSLVLPEGFETVGKNAFNGCDGFTGSLDLPSTLKSIGEKGIAECINISGIVVFPQNFESMGAGAFCTCNKITALRFTNSKPFTYTPQMVCSDQWGNNFFPVQVPTGSLAAFKTYWSDVPSGVPAEKITEYQ